MPRQQASVTGFGEYLIASGGSCEIENANKSKGIKWENKTVEILCTKSNRWRFLPDMERKRLAHASVVLNHSMLYLIDSSNFLLLNLECPYRWTVLAV